MNDDESLPRLCSSLLYVDPLESVCSLNTFISLSERLMKRLMRLINAGAQEREGGSALFLDRLLLLLVMFSDIFQDAALIGSPL